MSDKIFDDKEKIKEKIKEEIEITSGNITATLFNRKVAPVWILTDGDNPGWELIFNPFFRENKSFVLDEMKRKGFKGDGRKGDTINIARFIKTKEFGRTVMREYKKRRKENG